MIWLLASAYADTLSTPALATRLARVRAETAGSVVVVVGSGDDEQLVREAVTGGLLPNVRVIRGTTSTAGLEKGRANAGVGCAVGLAPSDDGRWAVVAGGTCGGGFGKGGEAGPEAPAKPAATQPIVPTPKATPAKVAATQPIVPTPKATPAKVAATPKVAVSAVPASPAKVVAPAPPASPAPSVAPPAAWNVALTEALLALPDPAARRTRLAEALTGADPGRTVRIAQAMAVVTHLEDTGRTDPSVVRFFLEAALDDDPSIRAAAVDAAARRGDPPRRGAPAPAAPVVATTEPVASAAPVVAATEPMVAAPEPVVAATEPVVATPEPIVATPEPILAEVDPAAALRAYRARHLARAVRTAAVAPPFASAPVLRTSWTVTEGDVSPLTPAAFATSVGDHALLDHLGDERTASRIGGGALIVGGALLGVAGIGLLDHADPVPPTLLLGAGALAAGGGVGWLVAVPHRQGRVDRYYTVDAADRRIEAYNASLRADLGLTDRDTLAVDLAPAAPTLTAWVGPGSAGLAGTF